MDQSILTADIGGTNARFGLAISGDHWTIEHFAKFQGDDYATFEAALSAYLEQFGGSRPERAIFSVAGPVANDKVTLTNRDWSLDGRHLEKHFGFKEAKVVNDFEAMTRSVPELTDADFLSVKPGNPMQGAPILVAGPGTGFGVGYLIPLRSGDWHVLTTEGGHQAYSPQTDRELALLKKLRRKFGFVTLEKVASGSGLDDVHQAICEIHGQNYSQLSPAVIAQKARDGNELCREICEIRAAAVMGAAADMALSGGARGGVVLAGGVSERMIEFFKEDEAMARFLNRGKRTDYLDDIPIRLLTNPMAALIGAAALLKDFEAG